MAIFKEHKVTVNDLLNVIPESLISHLSDTTGVDYYAKVLHGKKIFYLLMYGILEHDRLSQRTLEDIFNDSVFKVLFNLDEEEKVCRSSISERLSKIDSDFFRRIYDCIYDPFSVCYSGIEREKYNLIRVDSSMLSEKKRDLGDLILVKDSKVYLYTGQPVNNKRANNIGYKTAKRRFAIEIRDLAIAMIVIQCGGNPDLFFKQKKE